MVDCRLAPIITKVVVLYYKWIVLVQLSCQCNMLKQFFYNKRHAFVAYGGLFVIFLNGAFNAWIKVWTNDWYGRFYDLFQEAGSLASASNVTTHEWKAKQAEVENHLVEFAYISIVVMLVSPLSKFIRSWWALHWRLCLMHNYVESWDSNVVSIEGTSQRIHEDTYRFSKGIEMCLSTVLDAIITLAVFAPILHSLSANTSCPSTIAAVCFVCVQQSWLLTIAIYAATFGLLVTMYLGRRLVVLEVNNQVVEAQIRQRLVMMELHTLSRITDASSNIDELSTNYMKLFYNFSKLNTWLSLFEQFMSIAPYALYAPLLFDPDPSTRISLGVLVQVSNAFGKVFGALSIVADNWAHVNDFRSVLVRLKEFERSLYSKQTLTSTNPRTRHRHKKACAEMTEPVNTTSTISDQEHPTTPETFTDRL